MKKFTISVEEKQKINDSKNKSKILIVLGILCGVVIIGFVLYTTIKNYLVPKEDDAVVTTESFVTSETVVDTEEEEFDSEDLILEIDDNGREYHGIPCPGGLRQYKKGDYKYISIGDINKYYKYLEGEEVTVVGRVARVGNKTFELANTNDGGFVTFRFVCPIDPSEVLGQVVTLIGIVDNENNETNNLNIRKGHIIARGEGVDEYLENDTDEYFKKKISELDLSSEE